MERYYRNILIPGFGKEGQDKLQNAKVLVIGVGGLGSPVLFYLAAAGVGTIGMIDSDKVNISNLQRQILHYTENLYNYKVDSAKEKLEKLNPDIKFHTYIELFSAQNGENLARNYDFIVDCSDNYDTKFLINDICVKTKTPYCHAAVTAMKGEVMTILPESACYRCAFPEPPAEGDVATSSEIGVLGAVAGIVGSIQATEVVKYFTGVGELLTNKLLLIDAKTMTFYTLKVKKTSNCCCS
ncbi:HesA/MoeB/ThiF family protein [Bacteroides sp. 224]|uniref:HesA/MoeB/ThiF family protein n=1 Tax=Bacteroides sp. 224 TaxID=2302936 RepID=UPI0013D7CD9B|nr:HesA/MoeB/ThiF family protein [Bacteroides sp. 224]NDV64437.1 HesA/MoeB/ThiF family protein [Bacteroides sp. 224]